MNHASLQELLPLYALGVLEAAETIAVQAHLETGCPECERELRAHDATVASLASMVVPVAPPAVLRQRVLDAALAPSVRPAALQSWKNWTPSDSAPDLFLVRASEGEWESVLAGVSVKRLYLDAKRQTATMLVRMLPGTQYPGHRHAEAEECLVLEGDLHVGADLVMHAGDFQRAAAGSVHVPQFTVDGCLLLITSSLEDELLS